MRINTKTTNITLTPDISDYLEKRLVSLDKFISGKEDVIVDVEIGKTTNHHQTGDIYRAEINVHMGNKSFRAVSETGDLHFSIDDAKDEMLGELRSHKGKSLHLLRRGGQKIKELIKGLSRRNR